MEEDVFVNIRSTYSGIIIGDLNVCMAKCCVAVESRQDFRTDDVNM